MLHGISKMEKDPNEYLKVFKYQGMYFDTRGIIKATKSIWTEVKDNRTKKKILENIDRWHEIAHLKIDMQLAAHLWEDCYILTDGRVLNRKYEVQSDKDRIRLNHEGIRKVFYISDLLYAGFVDSNYDPELKQTWVQNFGKDLANLDNVELKDDYVAAQKKKSAKKTQPISKPQVSKKASPQPFDPFDPLAGWLPADEDWN